MQAQSFVLFVIVLIVETVLLEVNAKFKSSSKLPTRPDNSTELQPEVSGVQNRALIFIRNDGPTVFGSKTVFNVTVKAQPDLYLSFQWGTFIPYVWRNVRTYQYTESLEVDWWKSPGQKTIYFYIDALKRNSSKWNRIAQNSSSVQVIDAIIINVNVHQNGKLITDGKVDTGPTQFSAYIHDPHGFFRGSAISYVWMFNDGSPPLVTALDNVEHTFTKEGLFFIQLSASLKKNGRVYKGQASFYLRVKAILDGYILAWREHDHHPTLPSKEKSLPLGRVNFQFHLLDKYSSFVGAAFSYVWNFGDGEVANGSLNAIHKYTKLGKMNVVLAVTAQKNGNTYSSLIYKNISIQAPIKDLDVKSHAKLKKGTTVQFNITCRGSSPVSFCWYVTRGSCELPNDVICSPTKLYHHCKNTINHTFHHTGGYCVNVTVMNTVSFAEKSINIHVDGDEPSGGGKGRSGTVAVAVLPIVAGLLVLIAFFVGVKFKMQSRRRLARKTEVATFDFRSSQHSLHTGDTYCTPPNRSCRFLGLCKRLCPFDDEFESEHEMEERRMFREGAGGPSTPQRKVSYYGAIHRILGQNDNRDSTIAIAEEYPSPIDSHEHLSKSV